MFNQALLVPAESKAFKSIGFDKTTKQFAVVFHYATDKLYVYSNVSYQRNTAINHTESLGKYFAERIRPNKNDFPFVIETVIGA